MKSAYPAVLSSMDGVQCVRKKEEDSTSIVKCFAWQDISFSGVITGKEIGLSSAASLIEDRIQAGQIGRAGAGIQFFFTFVKLTSYNPRGSQHFH